MHCICEVHTCTEGDSYAALVTGFLVFALIAAVLGFGGLAGAAVGIAKILFFVFLVIWLIAFLTGAEQSDETYNFRGVLRETELQLTVLRFSGKFRAQLSPPALARNFPSPDGYFARAFLQ